MTKKIIRKAFVNKRNNQLSITIPKKEVKAIDPSIKFSDKLFVSLEFLKKGKK